MPLLGVFFCFSIRRGITNSYLVWIRHTLQLFILLHMQFHLLLQQRRLFVVLFVCHFYHLLICFLLLCHFLIIIQLNFLNNHEVVPVNVFRIHCTIFIIEFCVINGLLLSKLLLLSLVHLAKLTSLANFIDSLRRLSKILVPLKSFIFRCHDSTVRFYQIREIVEQIVSWLEKFKSWAVDLTISQSLQKGWTISRYELCCQFDRLHFLIG